MRLRRRISGERTISEYFFGHSEIELRRLVPQSTALHPITERLLRGAGLARGARVLDLGCGAGDLSMPAAAADAAHGQTLGPEQCCAWATV